MKGIAGLRLRRGSSGGLADFSAFYATNAERVLAFLTRRCLDPEVGVDLMAETFAQALESRRKYRGSSDGEAAAWVFGIARNVLADYFRRGKAEQKAVHRLGLRIPVLDDEDQQRVEELADLEPLRRVVTERFEELSGDRRDAIQLRVIDEMPYPEVARRLCVSEDAARARVSRGLRDLAVALQESASAKGALGHVGEPAQYSPDA